VKRDMDLVRELLLRFEATQLPAGAIVVFTYDDPALAVEGKSVHEIAYAIRMMSDAGFLELTPTQPANGICLRGLSWRGHEFLDTVRDAKIWNETKEGA
jgi:hypothetical protein